MLSAINESVVFHLEGIEDIDYTICADDKKTITHIQLKYSTLKQDASFMSSVIKNFLETYLIDKNRSFKLVYDFVPAVGNLSKLFHGNLDADSRKYWQNVIEKIKEEYFLWNWDAYDFDDFISKISFENVEKKSLEDNVERALIERYNITTDNINLFANGIKMFCVDRMENRGEITLKEIQKCIEAIRFDISKGAQNPAHSWIKRIDFTGSDRLSDYYESKKATPADIANNLPIPRPAIEKELIDSIVRYIGEIAQELWVYSKNCELLSADEDNIYLTHILTEIKEKIRSMLYEVKRHLPSEIYNDLNVLCEMTYKGKAFDDVELRNC